LLKSGAQIAIMSQERVMWVSGKSVRMYSIGTCMRTDKYR
jgi:hypothetical protein